MKDIHKIGKNRIFKIIGLTVVFYLIFFSKKNPDSLTNKVTFDEIKQGAHDIKEKTSFIKKNLQAAQDIKKEPGLQSEAKNTLEKKDEVEPTLATPTPVTNADQTGENYGDEKYKIICGDEVEISYNMVVKDLLIGGAPQYQKLIIGSNANLFLEEGLTGMSKGGSKRIVIPEKVESIENGKPVFSKKSDIAYQVTVISTKKAVQTNLCK